MVTVYSSIIFKKKKSPFRSAWEKKAWRIRSSVFCRQEETFPSLFPLGDHCSGLTGHKVRGDWGGGQRLDLCKTVKDFTLADNEVRCSKRAELCQRDGFLHWLVKD